MKINVTVKIKSSKEGIEKLSEDSYIIRINVPPVEGKANKRVVELLSKYFKRPQSQITLLKGIKSKNKIFKIQT